VDQFQSDRWISFTPSGTALANAGPPFVLEFGDGRLWWLTMESLAALRCLGIAGEQVLIDAYREAHVDVLHAIVGRRG